MKKLIHTHRMPIIVSVLIVISIIFTLALRSIAADNPAGGGKAAEIESTQEGKSDNDDCNTPGEEEECVDTSSCTNDDTPPDDTCDCSDTDPDDCDTEQ
jgi:hypothetical protein